MFQLSHTQDQQQTVVVEGTYVQEAQYDTSEGGQQYTDTGAYVYTTGGQTTTILVQGKHPDQIPEFIPQQYMQLQSQSGEQHGDMSSDMVTQLVQGPSGERQWGTPPKAVPTLVQIHAESDKQPSDGATSGQDSEQPVSDPRDVDPGSNEATPVPSDSEQIEERVILLQSSDTAVDSGDTPSEPCGANIDGSDSAVSAARSKVSNGEQHEPSASNVDELSHQAENDAGVVTDTNKGGGDSSSEACNNSVQDCPIVDSGKEMADTDIKQETESETNINATNTVSDTVS